MRQLSDAELQTRHHAEVPAAASDGPEEIRMARVVDTTMPTVCGHHLGPDDGVDRHPELAHEKPDAAVERDAADADGARVAETDHEAVRLQRSRDLQRGRTGFDPRRARVHVDIDARQVAQVDDDSAFRGAVARDAMAAAANGKLIAALARHADDPPHVVDTGDTNDRGRPFVDSTIENRARLVVVRIAGRDDAAVDVRERLKGRWQRWQRSSQRHGDALKTGLGNEMRVLIRAS